MIRFSYTLKCWALGITYYLGFYFIVLSSNPDFAKYLYILAVSTLLFPIAKSGLQTLHDATLRKPLPSSHGSSKHSAFVPVPV